MTISHINTTGTTSTNPISSSVAVVKNTGSGSHGIGTGAIAGIAIAIVLIATLCGSFFILRRRLRKRRSQKATMIPITDPKVVSDIDSDHKHDFADEPEVKKTATSTVTEAQGPMTPPSEVSGNEFFSSLAEKPRPQSRILELSADPVDRSEMPSPSPEDLRSELSTPEPKWNYPELPSPDPSQELPSPSLSAAEFGHHTPDVEQRCSPNLEQRRSALTSPEPHLPIERPDTIRGDSSDSEAGWSRDGMPTGPFHGRYHSDDSDAPSVSTRRRSSRMDPSDSDAFIHPNRIDESSAESESPTSYTRPTATHDNSSEFGSATSTPSISSSMTHQPPSNRTDPTSDSQRSNSPPNPRRSGVGSTFHSSSSTRPAATFHSSSSSRPGMRRASAVRPPTLRRGTSDGESWETRLESATESRSSTAGSMFGSIPIGHQRGDSVGNHETREGLLDEDNITRHD